MTRKEKLQLLRGIEKGNTSIESLKPASFFEVIQTADRPDKFVHNGCDMTQAQFIEFRRSKLKANALNVVWLEIRNS